MSRGRVPCDTDYTIHLRLCLGDCLLQSVTILFVPIIRKNFVDDVRNPMVPYILTPAQSSDCIVDDGLSEMTTGLESIATLGA